MTDKFYDYSLVDKYTFRFSGIIDKIRDFFVPCQRNLRFLGSLLRKFAILSLEPTKFAILRSSIDKTHNLQTLIRWNICFPHLINKICDFSALDRWRSIFSRSANWIRYFYEHHWWYLWIFCHFIDNIHHFSECDQQNLRLFLRPINETCNVSESRWQNSLYFAPDRRNSRFFRARTTIWLQTAEH